MSTSIRAHEDLFKKESKVSKVSGVSKALDTLDTLDTLGTLQKDYEKIT